MSLGVLERAINIRASFSSLHGRAKPVSSYQPFSSATPTKKNNSAVCRVPSNKKTIQVQVNNKKGSSGCTVPKSPDKAFLTQTLYRLTYSIYQENYTSQEKIVATMRGRFTECPFLTPRMPENRRKITSVDLMPSNAKKEHRKGENGP